MSSISSHNNCLKSDIQNLQEKEKSGFRGVSIDSALEIFDHKKLHKAECKGSPEYRTFKEQVKKLRMAKLPFRVTEIVNQSLKKGGHNQIPQSILQGPLSGVVNFSNDRKTLREQLEQLLVDRSRSHEQALQIAEDIHWLHGTNSSVLAMLPYTSYKMTSTGDLLEEGLAPMSGEIKLGGMGTNGVNQTHISVDSIRGFKRCWDYASRISHSFNPKDYKNPKGVFLAILDQLEKISPDDDRWDAHLIDLIRLKQWNTTAFQKLSKKYSHLIEKVRESVANKVAEDEQVILKAANYDKEKLLKASSDKGVRAEIEEDLRPYSDRYTIPDVFENEHVHPIGYFLDEYNLNRRVYNISDLCHLITNTLRLRAKAKEELEDMLKSGKKYAHINLNILKEDLGFSGLDAPTIEEIGSKNVHKLDVESAQSVDEDELMQRLVRDKVEKKIRKKIKPFERRLQRFNKIFETDPIVHFDEQQRELLLNPFPLLLASTNSKCYSISARTEYHVNHVEWGKEVDMVIVRSEDLLKMKTWLEQHSLTEKVTVVDAKMVEELSPIALYHSPDQVASEERVYSVQDIRKLEPILNEVVFPVYRTHYPNGEKRFWHGVPHAVRSTLFALIMAEMAKDTGKTLTHDKVSLLTAMAMHDAARENDGEDIWDEQSGALAKKVIQEKMQLTEDEASFFQNCVADKDNPKPESLEKAILHDGDCLEIMRCLRHPDDFDFKQLRMAEELGEESMLQLVQEAKMLIALTDKDPIKSFLENAKSPLKALIQVVHYSNEEHRKLELINTYGFKIYQTCSSASNYVLTDDVENAIDSFWISLS